MKKFKCITVPKKYFYLQKEKKLNQVDINVADGKNEEYVEYVINLIGEIYYFSAALKYLIDIDYKLRKVSNSIFQYFDMASTLIKYTLYNDYLYDKYNDVKQIKYKERCDNIIEEIKDMLIQSIKDNYENKKKKFIKKYNIETNGNIVIDKLYNKFKDNKNKKNNTYILKIIDVVGDNKRYVDLCNQAKKYIVIEELKSLKQSIDNIVKGWCQKKYDSYFLQQKILYYNKNMINDDIKIFKYLMKEYKRFYKIIIKNDDCFKEKCFSVAKSENTKKPFCAINGGKKCENKALKMVEGILKEAFNIAYIDKSEFYDLSYNGYESICNKYKNDNKAYEKIKHKDGVLFSCCERKLLPCLIKSKKIFLLVRWMPCEICRYAIIRFEKNNKCKINVLDTNIYNENSRIKEGKKIYYIIKEMSDKG